jgi:tight adherence protein C
METLLDIISNYDGGTDLVVLALVFIPTATIAFFVMRALRVRGTVRRRAAGIVSGEELVSTGGSQSLRHSGMRVAQRLVERTTKHYSSMDGKNMKMLRQRLIQAGIFDARAVGVFFLVRGVLAVGLGALAFALAPLTGYPSLQWPMVGCLGIFGYLAPSLALDRIVAARRGEYRAGFPDMMDLLVVCADAGLGLGAAFERVGRELGESYPNLSANIHMANLEVRAGRTMAEALEHFGDRLGLAEVRSFATLIQQSDELGSSITDALRVYSEDMRHKRLSTAEEKAYALPAKLSMPLMICVFPVLFVVILLPVIVRLYTGHY